MIVIDQQPTAITLSGNPLVYIVRAVDDMGDTITWRGAYSELRFTGYFDLAADQFSLNWDEPTGLSLAVDFFSAASPGADPREFPASSAGYPSIQAYFEAVADRLQAHPLVYPHFRIYAVDNGDGHSIIAVTRRYESGWEVEWGDTSITSGPYTITSDTELTTTAPENYRIHLDLFVESAFGTSDYRTAARLIAAPDAQGLVRFDVAQALHAAIMHSFPRSIQGPLPPAFDADEPILHDITRRYYTRIFETNTAGNVIFETLEDTEPLPAMAGGIAQNLAATYAFFENLSATNAFLTWRPDGRLIDTIQPEWLAWYNHTASAVTVVVQINQIDILAAEDVSYTFDTITPAVSVQPGQVLLIPVSVPALGIAADTVKYSVRVVDRTSDWEGGNPTYLSQARTYYVDRDHYHEVRYLQYLNGFMCPETLRCIGDRDVDLDISATESRRVLAPGFDDATAELITHNTDWADRFTYRTGHIPRLELEALRELLIYRRIYEVNTWGYIPLHLRAQRASFPVTSSRENLHSLTIQAEPALQASWYSNLNIPLTEESADWLTDAGLYWERLYGQPWTLP